MSQHLWGNHPELFIGILIGVVPALTFSLIGFIKVRRMLKKVTMMRAARVCLNFAFIQAFAINIFYIKDQFPKEKTLSYSLLRTLEHLLMVFEPTNIQREQIYWIIAHGEKERT